MGQKSSLPQPAPSVS